MLDARFLHLYFCQNLNRLQRGLSAIAELLVFFPRKLLNGEENTGTLISLQRQIFAP